MSRFVLPGSSAGLLVRGNIDIDMRANVAVKNQNGTISSVRTISFFRWTRPQEHPGDPDAKLGRLGIPTSVRQKVEHVEVLIPTVIPVGRGKWKVVSDGAAINHALSSGRHLGIFDNPKHATSYGNRLHLQQAAAGRKRR